MGLEERRLPDTASWAENLRAIAGSDGSEKSAQFIGKTASEDGRTYSVLSSKTDAATDKMSLREINAISMQVIFEKGGAGNYALKSGMSTLSPLTTVGTLKAVKSLAEREYQELNSGARRFYRFVQKIVTLCGRVFPKQAAKAQEKLASDQAAIESSLGLFQVAAGHVDLLEPNQKYLEAIDTSIKEDRLALEKGKDAGPSEASRLLCERIQSNSKNFFNSKLLNTEPHMTGAFFSDAGRNMFVQFKDGKKTGEIKGLTFLPKEERPANAVSTNQAGADYISGQLKLLKDIVTKDEDSKWFVPLQILCTQSVTTAALEALSGRISVDMMSDDVLPHVDNVLGPIEITVQRDKSGAIERLRVRNKSSLDCYYLHDVQGVEGPRDKSKRVASIEVETNFTFRLGADGSPVIEGFDRKYKAHK